MRGATRASPPFAPESGGIVLGSARVSRAGDCVSQSRTLLKVVLARHQNRHARRARYPAKSVCDRLLLLTLCFLQLESGGNRSQRPLPTLILLFCEEVFSWRALTRTNEMERVEYSGSWLSCSVAGVVDPGRGQRPRLQNLPFSRLHRWKNRGRHARPYNDWLVGNRIQLQQRNCSGFTPDFSRRST